MHAILLNLKGYLLSGFHNTKKNIREAECAKGQKEGTLEDEKRCVNSGTLSRFPQLPSELYPNARDEAGGMTEAKQFLRSVDGWGCQGARCAVD